MLSESSIYKTDCLIVGGGGAGLYSAISLLRAGIKPTLITKSTILGSHTTAAKGGINASLGSVTEDNYAWHLYDTVKSGDGLCDSASTEYMCKNAPDIISSLENLGVNFDSLNGKIEQRRYGGQTTHFGKGDFAFRACFVKDETGSEIMKKLYNSTIKIGLDVKDYIFATNLYKNEDDSYSLECVDLQKGKRIIFVSRYIIWASGGFSQLYWQSSSSSLLTGDGHAILMRAGCKIKDPEFVQFHPTGLYGSGILISEACRGEGGYLINLKGERFMENYSSMGELASRDVVAKAIYAEHLSTGGVFLDMRHLKKDLIESRLKNSKSIAKFFGKVDIESSPVQVFPTAHYNMGGMEVDINYQSKLENIFIIGEAACASVHGANRLGCNSLLELFTSAKLAADFIIKNYKTTFSTSSYIAVEKVEKVEKENISFENVLTLKHKMQDVMDLNVGIIRSNVSLMAAFSTIESIESELNEYNVNFSKWNNVYVLFNELLNMILLSKSLLLCAISRKESRGSHFREDFPNKFPEAFHSLIGMDMKVQYIPAK